MCGGVIITMERRGNAAWSPTVGGASVSLWNRGLKVSTGVSPFRQSATSHMFRNWLFNGYRRLSAQLPYWVIPVGIGEFVVMFLSHP
jgi:hypothetical protein